MPTRLYLVIFPIIDLRQAIDAVKRIVTREILDRQMTGQASTSPFITGKDGQSNSRPHNHHSPHSCR